MATDEYQEQLKELRLRVYRLRAEGVKQREIAKLAGISDQQLSMLLNDRRRNQGMMEMVGETVNRITSE